MAVMCSTISETGRCSPPERGREGGKEGGREEKRVGKGSLALASHTGVGAEVHTFSCSSDVHSYHLTHILREREGEGKREREKEGEAKEQVCFTGGYTYNCHQTPTTKQDGMKFMPSRPGGSLVPPSPLPLIPPTCLSLPTSSRTPGPPWSCSPGM